MTPELKPKEERDRKKNNRLQIVREDGTFVRSIGKLNDFHNPEGVAVLPSGTIVVSVANHNRLVLVKEDGTFLRTIGSQGSGPNQFNSPHGVIVLPNGTIVVCDHGNHRLQFVKEDGTFLKSIGNGEGSGPNQFTPVFIARLPNGVLVVKDSSNGNQHRLQFVQEDGTFLGSHNEGPRVERYRSPSQWVIGSVQRGDPLSRLLNLTREHKTKNQQTLFSFFLSNLQRNETGCLILRT